MVRAAFRLGSIEHSSSHAVRIVLHLLDVVLQSIYGEEAIKAWASGGQSPRTNGDSGTIRYEVILRYVLVDQYRIRNSNFISSVPTDDEEVPCHILVSIPPTYPSTAPPQLQLLSKYIGPFSVDSTIFGAVLRTYISSEGVEWVNDSVCVFDGLEWVKERCAEWYGDKKSEKLAGQLLREDERSTTLPDVEEDENKKVSELHDDTEDPLPSISVNIPEGVEIITAEPIVDRRSAFVGRACRISNPSQVCDRIRLSWTQPTHVSLPIGSPYPCALDV